jgi:nicotinate-nucleotide adenylyltransferase
MTQKSKLGLLGGSFDPVHNAHLELALNAIKEFGIERVIFIPAFRPPHKMKLTFAPAQKRLKMIALAIKPYKNLSISRFELNKRAPIYTFQTVDYFKKLYPKKEIYFIIGSDSLNELNTWKNNFKLIAGCKFIVGKRKGIRISKPEQFKNQFLYLSKIIPNISSTKIRNSVKTGESLTKLVPESVKKYIISEKLYKN